MNLKKLGLKMAGLALLVAVAIASIGGQEQVVASDHDDGETQIKARNLNLTDLYVFMEGWQDSTAVGDNMIIILNTNPRSLPRQQYFFNTEALYNIHIGRQAGAAATAIDNAVTGTEDMRFEFQFAAPTAANTQAFEMAVTTFAGGVAQNVTVVPGGVTTAAAPLIGSPNPTPTVNNLNVNGTNLCVFAGLREDPFFFDVEAFFKVRAFLAGQGPGNGGSLAGGFFNADNSTDFAAGYNVNAIVIKVPLAFLQSAASEVVFDVWSSITVPNDLGSRQ